MGAEARRSHEGLAASVLLSEIYWGMMPFMMLQLAGLVIVYFFPELATWLPKVVFGG